MATHRFRIVNVFTQDRGTLTGNPLCVFEPGPELDGRTMQALARQFNLSETTFIAASPRAAAHVRIFTPNYELPFAGHPTLGTAHVCRALGLGGDALKLDMKAGLIDVEAAGDRWTLTAPESGFRELDVPRAALAKALGLEEGDIGDRPLWVKAGKEQLIVPLRSTDAVRRAAPSSSAMAAIKSEDGVGMAYVFSPDGPGKTLARFFFPNGPSMLEDPATGSATANFGGWCLAMKETLPLALEISQGAMAGRPSTLFLEVTRERRIRVGGDVIELGSGTISL
jgi:trans-2,3-dihydro-3-hydroxyanthranilate isomerase